MPIYEKCPSCNGRGDFDCDDCSVKSVKGKERLVVQDVRMDMFHVGSVIQQVKYPRSSYFPTLLRVLSVRDVGTFVVQTVAVLVMSDVLNATGRVEWLHVLNVMELRR
jgi:hypothetical protein